MMAEKREIIATDLFNSRANGKDFIEKRETLIQEALNFPQGIFEKPKRNVVFKIANGKEAYFLKPGKETLRKTPNKNEHDMLPNVAGHFDKWAFEQVWEYLIKISIVQQAAFKEVLILLYRLCFYIDHELVNKKLRYKPSVQILEYVNNLEQFVLRDGFKEKFKTSEVDLLEFLYFVDLLAWNEDVKYHSANNKADFAVKSKKNAGRVNTIISIIRTVILLSGFLEDQYKNYGIFTLRMMYGTVSKIKYTKIPHIIPNKKLLEYLNPYLRA